MKKTIIAVVWLTTFIRAQITSFPFRESFDSVSVPSLPAGWIVSTNKNISGDFVTTASSVRSAPNAVSSTDATKGQWLISPFFSFTGKFPDRLEFYERRTASHTSGLLVEAAIEMDTLFSIPLSDTLKHESSTAYVKRTIPLPEGLNGTDSVRFRWRVIGNGSGATGVIRFDDMQITVKKSVDLALTSISLHPALPKAGETVAVSAVIRNNALAGSFSGSVRLTDPPLFELTQPFSASLAENESVTVIVHYPAIKAGSHLLGAELLLTGDEDTSNNVFSFPFSAGFPSRTLLINEIMYVPTPGMPEWIEIVNAGEDTVSVSGWRIADGTTNKAVLIPSGTKFAPQSYAVVTTDTAAFKNFFSSSPRLLQASFSALNNSGDAVALYDPAGSVIDSLTYASSWGGASGGRSLERIDTTSASTDQSNWKTSLNPLGATPGFINSVTQKNFDIAVGSVFLSPEYPVTGFPSAVTAAVRNTGKQPVSSIDVKFFIDANRDSILSLSELHIQRPIAFLSAGDSVPISVVLPPLQQGIHFAAVRIEAAKDDDTTNNHRYFPFTVGIPRNSIIINEIMYAPTGDMPEWIEGFNTTDASIDIAGWKISDNGTARLLITGNQAIIPPQSFFVITTDTNQLVITFPDARPIFQSSIPSLNNTAPDAVIVYDERGAVMDSVYYKPAWGGSNGFSLQRYDEEGVSVDSANWRSAFPTPGRVNAVVRKYFDARIKSLRIAPTFPVAGQIVTVTAAVENIGKKTLNSIIVSLYLDANNDSTAVEDELIAREEIHTIDPLDSVIITTDCIPHRSGHNRIFVNISGSGDEDNSNNTGIISFTVGAPPRSILITEIMYNPPNDIPEWIEFFNNTPSPVDVSGWKIADNGSTRTAIAQSGASIPPMSYFIVTTDSLFHQLYSVTAPVFIAPFSALNNTTADAVVVSDPFNRVIDSVSYRPSWGGMNGMTLQLYDLFGSSTDSSNWRSASSSPGVENVISRKDFDAEIRNVRATKNGSGFFVEVTLFNPGRESAGPITISIYHDRNIDSVGEQQELIHTAIAEVVLPLDSLTVSFQWDNGGQGKQRIIVSAEFTADQNPGNNYSTAVVANNYPPQSIIINEIMYEPLTGKSEFVELMNRSADTVDLEGWRLMDQPNASGSRTTVSLAHASLRIPPGGYCVVAGDSSVLADHPSLISHKIVINSSLSLSNSGEDLVLTDLTGALIDSVRYSPRWHLSTISTVGRSLERINPVGITTDGRNWSTSVAKAGATPGAHNSIRISSQRQSSSLSLLPNPFSPDNDGHEDFLSIGYSLPAASATIRVRIYDVTGRLVRRLAVNEPSSSQGSIIWNGFDDEGHRVRIGMYIILFEAYDNFGGTVKTMKDVAVVARKL
jgi:hypothetical protein